MCRSPADVIEVLFVGLEGGFGLKEGLDSTLVEPLDRRLEEASGALGLGAQRLSPASHRLAVAVSGVLVSAHPGVGGDILDRPHRRLVGLEGLQQARRVRDGVVLAGP